MARRENTDPRVPNPSGTPMKLMACIVLRIVLHAESMLPNVMSSERTAVYRRPCSNNVQDLAPFPVSM